jgi:hypothetical protein
MTLEIQRQLQGKFNLACNNNDLKTVKYLLGSPGLAKHIDVGTDEFYHLAYPLRNMDESFIDCLLAHAKEKDQIHIKEIFKEDFNHACRNVDLDKLYFLHRKEKYKQYVDMSRNAAEYFDSAYNAFNVSYEGRLNVLKFLILEVGLTRDNENIVRIMRSNGSVEASKLFRDTIDIFNKQKLPSVLDEQLPVNEEVKPKPKLKI